MKSDKIIYYRITQEVLEHIEYEFPESVKEAKGQFGELADILVFDSHDSRVLAQDLFIKGYLLAKHGTREVI